MTTILFVCTGNICRSPMAEGFLERLLTERGIEGIEVVSAGVGAWDDDAATPEAVEALREAEADIAGHRARRLTASMISSADLIVAMAAEHRDAIIELDAGATPRTFTLKELVALLEGAPNGVTRGSPEERLRQGVSRADALRQRPDWGRLLDENVADPLGLGLDSFRATAWELSTLVHQLADGLFGSPTPGREERNEEVERVWGAG